MTNPARFFSSKKDGTLLCGLCPRRCLLAAGQRGRCKVRYNREGEPDLPFYGFITSLASDPIEKKPLYHFRPGTEILSVGFAGCNLNCPFCQNWRISQTTDVAGRRQSPSELIATVKQSSPAVPGITAKDGINASWSIAYTYSEPLVHVEFLLDCMKEARKAGIANVLVSNGNINADAAAEILELTDAANIDLKSFSGETYRDVLGGDLCAVTNFIRLALEKKVHLELTTLVVSGLNDSKDELDKCRDFIAELQTGGNTVPWHLSAYHPDHKWRAPATDPLFLEAAADGAKEKLIFVYTGNIAAEKNDTPCPHCGKILIYRRGYRVDLSGISLKEVSGKLTYLCAACGKSAPVKW